MMSKPRWVKNGRRIWSVWWNEVTDEVFESPASIVFDQAEKPDAHHKSCYGRYISKITFCRAAAPVAPGSDHLRF